MADTANDTESAAAAADICRKSLPAPTKHVDLAARTVEHYVSVPTLDEDGEVLLPRGADISRFTKSPTVFDVHEYGSKSVVGQCLSMKLTDEGIVATTRFAPRPPAELWPADKEWEPDRLLWLYYTGDIKGWSIGFRPIEGRQPTKKDVDAFGDTLRHVHTRYKVLEYSVAPLPCCPDALTLSAKGILSARLAESLKGGKLPTKEETPKAEDAPAEGEKAAEPKKCPDCGKPMGKDHECEPEKAAAPAQVRVIAPPRRKLYVVIPAAVPPAPVKAPDVAAMVRRAVAKAAGKLYAD
jgi:hypothetical protein